MPIWTRPKSIDLREEVDVQKIKNDFLEGATITDNNHFNSGTKHFELTPKKLEILGNLLGIEDLGSIYKIQNMKITVYNWYRYPNELDFRLSSPLYFEDGYGLRVHYE